MMSSRQLDGNELVRHVQDERERIKRPEWERIQKEAPELANWMAAMNARFGRFKLIHWSVIEAGDSGDFIEGEVVKDPEQLENKSEP